MEKALYLAKSDMEVAKGRAQELESLAIKKDQVIAEQKVLHNKILVGKVQPSQLGFEHDCKKIKLVTLEIFDVAYTKRTLTFCHFFN